MDDSDILSAFELLYSREKKMFPPGFEPGIP